MIEMKVRIRYSMSNLRIVGLILAAILIHYLSYGQTNESVILKREIKILKGQKYLNLPVNSSDQLKRLTIKIKDIPLDRFTINLAEKDPQFWTFFDISSYQGKTITILMEKAGPLFPGTGSQNAQTSENSPLNPAGLNMIYPDSIFPGQDSLYSEAGRPQVHFSASRGWINDPNGLIFYNGVYNMYFQHNPYGWQWGNMHWGHAVSNDLVHWRQLNEAIYPVLDGKANAAPFGMGDAAFSGSAVIDPSNTANFRKDGIDPIIVIYTSTGRGECLKMSYDNGLTFVDYTGNPILVHDGRDPKVFWYEPGKHWVMVVWESGKPKKLSTGIEVGVRQHSIYTSLDLKTWTYQSGVPGFYECPELFELPVVNEPGVSKWIMYDADGRYIVGDFNGREFSIEQGFTKYENGGGYFYASQTFSNIPDKRRIQVGWGRNITNPGMPFNQPELFPTELTLRKTLNGYKLCPVPIREISSLYSKSYVVTNQLVQPGESAVLDVDADKPLHITADIERGNAPIIFNILGYEFRYDNEWMFYAVPSQSNVSQSAEPSGPFPKPSALYPVNYIANSDAFHIEAIVDKNILEVYINGGELYYVTAFNGKKVPRIEASVPKVNMGPFPGRRSAFMLKKLEVNELKSIWSNPKH
jgi:fructan beta-fructosidase